MCFVLVNMFDFTFIIEKKKKINIWGSYFIKLLTYLSTTTIVDHCDSMLKHQFIGGSF